MIKSMADPQPAPDGTTVDTGTPKAETEGRMERRKSEVGLLARATLKAEGRRQLTDADGKEVAPQTPEQQALKVYQDILTFKKGDDALFDAENPPTGNAIALPEFGGIDSNGKPFQYANNEASIRQVVGVTEDGQLEVTLWENDKPKTITVKDAKTGEEYEVDLVVPLAREDVANAQFLSEQPLYESAVGSERAKLLEAHAAILPQTPETFVATDETDTIIEDSAKAVNVLTAKDILEASFFKKLDTDKKEHLEKVLSAGTVLTPQELQEVTAMIGWDQVGVRRKSNELAGDIAKLQNRTDDLGVKQRTELEEQLKMLKKVDDALAPRSDGSTQVTDVLTQLQNGELDDTIAKGMKEAIITGNMDHIFNALDLPEDVKKMTVDKVKTTLKIAGYGGLGLAALIAIIVGGTISVAGSAMSSASRR